MSDLINIFKGRRFLEAMERASEGAKKGLKRVNTVGCRNEQRRRRRARSRRRSSSSSFLLLLMNAEVVVAAAVVVVGGGLTFN